jgi:CCR4-NOT transcription complex subunit 3
MSLIFQHIHLVWFSQNPSASTAESTQLRDTDLSPGQPLQHGMTSSGVGVIGRRSVSDLGAIGDNLTGTAASSNHDLIYNLQMLEAAFHKLPQPKDSERAKNYVPVWTFTGFCYKYANALL